MMALIWLGSASANGARTAISLVRGIIVDSLAPAAPWPYLGLVIQKTGHFLEYLLLAALLYRALTTTRTTSRHAAVLTIVLAVSYAILDEWHQSFVPGREPALRDVLIDSAGALTALVLATHRNRLKRPRTAN